MKGPTGTQGFANITLPIAAIPYGTTPLVYIDGQPAADQGYTQDANNYYIWYTTHFSSHQIAVMFTVEPQPTPTPSPHSTEIPPDV